MVRIEENVFEPAIYSDEELTFLLDHLEHSPVVALHKGVPVGVNPLAIQTFLAQLQTLIQLESVHSVKWAGLDAVKDSILRYLSWRERSEEIYRRTGGPKSPSSIKHPSQYAWDSSGRAFKYAIDADSAEMPRTEILDDGSRRPFGVRLLQPEGQIIPSLEEVAPWVRQGHRPAVTDEVKDEKKGKHGALTCSICGRAESFQVSSRQTFLAARSRMARHLKNARDEVARHRLLYRKVYESPTARTTT